MAGSIPAPPYIVITEQPRSGELRFRYACEGRNAGTLKGNTHSPKSPIYPTIQVNMQTIPNLRSLVYMFV